MKNDFEGVLRTKVDLVEDDIRLILDGNDSNFSIFELEQNVYSFKDLSGAF